MGTTFSLWNLWRWRRTICLLNIANFSNYALHTLLKWLLLRKKLCSGCKTARSNCHKADAAPPRLALHKVIKKMFDYAAMFGVGALILFSNNEESLKNIKIGYLTAEGKTMLPVDRNFWGTGMGVIKGLRDNCRRPWWGMKHVPDANNECSAEGGK